MSDPSQQSPLPSLLREALGEAYTIEGEIGRGGMGVVYRARDERLHRRVAVKVLPPELAFQREIRERFAREAQTAARLAHPHIVPIHDVGEGNGIVYFVMGLVEGESLAARVKRRGRLPADEARRIMRETADALSAAHELGVIHRDIKPDNILLEGARGRVMVTDFGIAKAVSATSNATLTSAGMAIGTPSFMSPEQAAGEREIDGRSDIYSLGVVSYYMLAGELPFNAPTVAGILMKHITEPAPLLHERFPDVPEDLSLAVARCLEKDPTNRWIKADALRRALESRNIGGYRPTGTGMSPRARPPAPSTPRGLASRRPEVERVPARTPRPLTQRPQVPTRSRGRDLAGPASGRTGRPEKSKDDMVLPETGEPKIIRQTRAEFAKMMTVTAGCLMINIATGIGAPWFLLVGGAMSFNVFKRYSEMWQAGYSWRDVINRPPAPDAITNGESRVRPGRQLGNPSTAEFGPHAGQLMQAHNDRRVIISLWTQLAPIDREMFPEMLQTVDDLYERACQLARLLHALDDGGMQNLALLDARIEDLRSRPESEERDRQIALLERQRHARTDLDAQQFQTAERLESALLMMQNLRLEVLRIKDRGIGAMENSLGHATQQARALSRDVDRAISAAAEARKI